MWVRKLNDQADIISGGESSIVGAQQQIEALSLGDTAHEEEAAGLGSSQGQRWPVRGEACGVDARRDEVHLFRRHVAADVRIAPAARRSPDLVCLLARGRGPGPWEMSVHPRLHGHELPGVRALPAWESFMAHGDVD